jgi:hypothetical protein
MISKNNHFKWCDFMVCTLIVLFIWTFIFKLIYCYVDPIYNKDQVNLLSIFLVVLVLLASGSIAGFFSFEYINAKRSEFKIIQVISYIFIGGIFLLIFLSIYCLAKVGIFKILDKCVIFFLFISIFCVLDGIVLLDRWDATKRKKERKIK